MAALLEHCYALAPVWAQNCGISLYGLAWRRERLGGEFERHVESYRSRDQWPAERMREYLQERLSGALLHAFDQAPYYRRSWTAAGFQRQDLQRITLETLHWLPATPKQDLRERPELFLARDTARNQRLHRQLTSGSTGTPITALCTSDEHRQFIAAREARSFGWAGASIRDPRAMIGGRKVVPDAISQPPFHRYNRVERQVYFSAYHIAPAHVPSYVEAFNRHRPSLLTGYACSYYLLGRMMLEQGRSLDYRPQALVLSSEKLTSPMKQVLREAFRARAFEEYGAVENCALATECEAGGLHVNPDFGIVELIDSAGKPVVPGLEGQILCTSLVKAAQPLIRYAIGDTAAWEERRCPCGRNHLPLLREIAGRLEDVVVGRDGRQMVRFHGIFVGLPHVAEAQVIQETLEHLTVKVVPSAGFGTSDETLIRQRLAERLGEVSVRIEAVPQIPRTERGKFRAVISRLKPGTPGVAKG